MSTPNQVVPSGYASVVWSIPTFTEGTYALQAAVIDSIQLGESLEIIPITGNTGFVAGFTEMIAGSNGVGGTKVDTDELTINCTDGVVSGKQWPALGSVVTLAAFAAPLDNLNSKWKVMKRNTNAQAKQQGKRTFTLQRWCDVSL
jgi:hypothetical protein